MVDYAAFPPQRQCKIKQLLSEQGRVVCAELSRALNVSEHTIRRDLKELARAGACKRVYGGAVNMLAPAGNFNERLTEDDSVKADIARAAVGVLKPDTCVFIDAGTTNLAVARLIPDTMKLTVVCNSPLIAAELLRHPELEVILIGGKINRETGGAVSIDTLRQLETMYFDQCLLGGCAFDVHHGLTVFGYEEAEFKKTLLRRSNEIFVALTANKLSALARYRVCDSDDITTLFTDKGLSDASLNLLQQHKLNVIVAR
ncbi:DeoR family transcriptional regulator [Biostraticola tofi]|uniref:DeoR family transcriptional regulator n=2 Tax=Biostraticola tofi TaxID=466109 RepID=A0A4R3Z2U8_9GAMM|nr:DeoR family transcriptional regulator [Biostraticola tofi]